MTARTPEERAREIVEKWIGSPAHDEVCGLLAKDISAALLAAERRGIERAAEAVKRVGEYLAEDTFRGTGGRGRTAQEHGAWLAKQIEKEIRAIAGEEVPK